MKIRNAIGVAATAALLLGCAEAGVVKAIGETVTGGSGGSAGAGSAPAWPVADVAKARRFGLGLPPTLSGPALAAGTAWPDTVLATDVHVFPDSGGKRVVKSVPPAPEPLVDPGDTVRPVMSNSFFDLAQVRSADGTVFGYGGWLDASSFIVGRERVEGGLLVAATSVGVSSASNPQASGAAGTATWLGSMVGRGTGSADGALYQGGAGLEYDFAASTLDVAFFRIRDLNTGAARADIRWEDLAVRNGRFVHPGPHMIRGTFYGAGHAEAGGVFESRGIAGAFGAKRHGN